ncbi:hypothetical protein BjapCC829_49130 (plasmid) [Bradyrhizobium barranii]|uniref:Uncharacterized protein n=1 Tax=Bradyrhizobium barranii TaxID=2992140 RepID=A0ABY3R117_9BRAD|nr:hypothetical protein [Bradyrhizobium japonicum]UFW91956.1 hypothetical protein BjapCC829_49130 [Bradyrhizobium japonicum]
MNDLMEKLNKLRADAADLAVMSSRASDPQKHDLFRRLADELATEALVLEQVVKRQSTRSAPVHMDNVVPLTEGPERN